jgi:hypothetical protein
MPQQGRGADEESEEPERRAGRASAGDLYNNLRRTQAVLIAQMADEEAIWNDPRRMGGDERA